MLKLIIAVAFVACVSAQSTAPAVEQHPRTFYRLDFVLREVENDRVINTRAYSLILANHKDRAEIRAGEKVPFSSASGARTEWQQIDVGVNIDCADLEEVGDQISMYVASETSSVIENHGDNKPPPSLPIIRSHRWRSTVILPLKQPTILYSSDDPASKHKMQLQLTATMLR